MEERTGKAWSQIIEPQDAEVDDVCGGVTNLKKRGKRAWVFVNNHFEGCAPRTIAKIRERLG